MATNADNKARWLLLVPSLPLLVRLLGADSVRVQAVKVAVRILADNADDEVVVATAIAVPILIKLLGPGSTAVQEEAVDALEPCCQPCQQVRSGRCWRHPPPGEAAGFQLGGSAGKCGQSSAMTCAQR